MERKGPGDPHVAPEVRLEQERNGHRRGSRSSELDLERGSVRDSPSATANRRQSGDEESQRSDVDRAVRNDVSVGKYRVRRNLIRTRFGNRGELEHRSAERVFVGVKLRGVAGVSVTGRHDGNARTVNLVEEQLQPLRMLRLHREVEVGIELALVTAGVVDGFSITIGTEVVRGKLPFPTVVTDEKRHLAVQSLSAERHDPQRAAVVDVGPLILSIVVVLIELTLDAVGCSDVFVWQNLLIAAGAEPVKANRELKAFHHEIANISAESVLVVFLRGRSELAEAPGIQ